MWEGVGRGAGEWLGGGTPALSFHSGKTYINVYLIGPRGGLLTHPFNVKHKQIYHR